MPSAGLLCVVDLWCAEQGASRERVRAAGGGFAGGNRQVRRLVARGALRRAPLRCGMLVAPRDDWPPVDGGLELVPAGHAPDGAPLFAYTHSPAYLVRGTASAHACKYF